MERQRRWAAKNLSVINIYKQIERRRNGRGVAQQKIYHWQIFINEYLPLINIYHLPKYLSGWIFIISNISDKTYHQCNFRICEHWLNFDAVLTYLNVHWPTTSEQPYFIYAWSKIITKISKMREAISNTVSIKQKLLLCHCKIHNLSVVWEKLVLLFH